MTITKDGAGLFEAGLRFGIQMGSTLLYVVDFKVIYLALCIPISPINFITMSCLSLGVHVTSLELFPVFFLLETGLSLPSFLTPFSSTRSVCSDHGKHSVENDWSI